MPPAQDSREEYEVYGHSLVSKSALRALPFKVRHLEGSATVVFALSDVGADSCTLEKRGRGARVLVETTIRLRWGDSPDVDGGASVAGTEAQPLLDGEVLRQACSKCGQTCTAAAGCKHTKAVLCVMEPNLSWLQELCASADVQGDLYFDSDFQCVPGATDIVRAVELKPAKSRKTGAQVWSSAPVYAVCPPGCQSWGIIMYTGKSGDSDWRCSPATDCNYATCAGSGATHHLPRTGCCHRLFFNRVIQEGSDVYSEAISHACGQHEQITREAADAKCALPHMLSTRVVPLRVGLPSTAPGAAAVPGLVVADDDIRYPRRYDRELSTIEPDTSSVCPSCKATGTLQPAGRTTDVTVMVPNWTDVGNAPVCTCRSCNNDTVLVHPNEHLLLVFYNQRTLGFSERDLLRDHLTVMHGRNTAYGLWKVNCGMHLQSDKHGWVPYSLYLEVLKALEHLIDLQVHVALVDCRCCARRVYVTVTPPRLLQLPPDLKAVGRLCCTTPNCLQLNGVTADGTQLSFLKSSLHRFGDAPQALPTVQPLVGLTTVQDRAFLKLPKCRQLLRKLSGVDHGAAGYPLTEAEWNTLTHMLSVVQPAPVQRRTIPLVGSPADCESTESALRAVLHRVLLCLDGDQGLLKHEQILVGSSRRAGRTLKCISAALTAPQRALLERSQAFIADMAVPSLATALLPPLLCESLHQIVLAAAAPHMSLCADGEGPTRLRPAVLQCLQLNCPRLHAWVVCWEANVAGDESGLAATAVDAAWLRATAIALSCESNSVAADSAMTQAQHAMCPGYQDPADVFPGMQQVRAPLPYKADEGRAATATRVPRGGAPASAVGNRCDGVLDVNADPDHPGDFCVKRALRRGSCACGLTTCARRCCTCAVTESCMGEPTPAHPHYLLYR